VVMTVLAACRNHTDIVLQKVTQSSNGMECDKVFSADRKSIVEMNEILMQTGTVDSAEYAGIRSAIIHVGNKEEVLKLQKNETHGSTVTEVYIGDGYKVILNYETQQSGYITGYKGNLEVWKGKLYTKMDVEGLVNRL
jgi:hypothetical protein